MKRIIYMILPLMAGLWTGCVSEPQFSDSPMGNFESCWKTLDEHYCFFGYKDINWDEVHDRYAARIGANIGKDSLFEVLDGMLKELKDGHVNLYSPFDLGRYWDWFESYPDNFDEKVHKNYLGNDYKIAGGFKYTILREDSIGYAYFGSFSSGVGELNLDYILHYMRDCRGVIIDVRDNGGGELTNVDRIVGRFIENKITAGYISHKTGKGHDEFSELHETTISPSSRITWSKPVVVVCNRSTYSAANNFVSVMKGLPGVTVIGDVTGGGCGMPFSSELPNGWTIRFSASPIYDRNRELTEFGVEPDIRIDMSDESMLNGVDDILERAREEIIRSYMIK